MTTTSTYPEGTMFWETVDYKGYLLRNINATLIAISTVILGTRLYVRLAITKTPGLDDIIATFAWAVICTQSALDVVEVKHGSGAHLELLPSPLVLKFFELLATQSLVYFWSVGLMRLAIVAFLPRLSKDRIYMYIVCAAAAIIVIQTNCAFWYKLLECRPIKDIWKPPFAEGLNCVPIKDDDNMMVAHAIIGIIMDMVMMVLPIWMIWQKMILTKKVIQVVLIFSVGVFVVITGIIRLWYIKTLVFAIDPTYKMATIGVWTDLEGHVGLWVGCFPAMQPIIRIVSAKIGHHSKLPSYGAKSAENPNGIAGASIKEAQRSTHGYIRSGNGVDRAGTDTDADSQKAIVASDDNFELGQIRKQTDLEVKVEEIYPEKKGSRQESWADV